MYNVYNHKLLKFILEFDSRNPIPVAHLYMNFLVLKEYATGFWVLFSIVAKLKRFITVGWPEV